MNSHADSPGDHAAPGFVVDEMLARLARWMRVLGYDTLFDPRFDDAGLVALAEREGRWLATRDRTLIRERRPRHGVLITHDDPLHQLRQLVVQCQPPKPTALFTRCLLCNTRLRPASTAEIAANVPAGARALPGEVRVCPTCRRVYWPGSHTWRMRARLAEVLPGWVAPQP